MIIETTILSDMMNIFRKLEMATETMPVMGMTINTKMGMTISILSSGVKVMSRALGMILWMRFSTWARTQTPTTTPIMPPALGARMDLAATSSLTHPNVVAMVEIAALVEAVPIMPPSMGLTPNCLAAFTPVKMAK